MEYTKGKIVDIKSTQPVNTPSGSKFRFVLMMENGDKGSTISQNENDFTIGQELEYIVESRNGFSNIKIKREKKGGFAPRNPKADFIIGAMQCACQLISANKVEIEKLEPTFNQLYSLMQKKYGE